MKTKWQYLLLQKQCLTSLKTLCNQMAHTPLCNTVRVLWVILYVRYVISAL